MSERRGTISLAGLPAALLEEIAKHSLGPSSFFGCLRSQPLLGVARDTRDASLRRASKIALDLKPSGRLLSRACSLASSSLELHISMSEHGQEDQADKVFAAFLYASGQRGWQAVSSLYLSVSG
jgi:hypothetical protein